MVYGFRVRDLRFGILSFRVFHVEHRWRRNPRLFHVKHSRRAPPGSGGARFLATLPPSDVLFLQHLAKNNKTAAKILDERPGRLVDERRCDKCRRLGAGCCSEQQDPPAQTQERLDVHEEPLLHPDGPDGDEILRLVQLGPRQQILRSRGLYRRVGKIQMPNRFSQEGRLPCL